MMFSCQGQILTVFFLAKSPDAPNTTIVVLFLSSTALQGYEQSALWVATESGVEVKDG